MPTLCNIDFRLLATDGSAYLAYNLLDWHHPEKTFAFSHSCINEAGTDIGDNDVTTCLESLLAQGFHVVDLVGFRRAVCWCNRFATQPTSRGNGYEVAMPLLLEDVVEHINDESPARDICVNRWTFHIVVERGIKVACSRAYKGEVKASEFCMECIDCFLNLILFGNVGRGSICIRWVLVLQFI